MLVVDFQGQELSIGDEIAFISAPQSLNKGTITGFSQRGQGPVLVELVTGETSYTMKAASFVCAKLR